MEELCPYAKGEWLKLETKEDLKSSLASTTDSEAMDTEEPVDRILRGPIWNYGRKKYDDKEFREELLYGKTKKTTLREEELIIKGEKWIPAHPPNLSLAEYVFRKIKKVSPTATALVEIETGRQLNYEELIHQARSLAGGLEWLGMQPGHVIAIVSYNSLEAHLMVLASLFVGSVSAILDSCLNAVDLGALLRIAKPDIVFTESGQTLLKVETAIGYLMSSRRPHVVVNTRRRTGFSHFLYSQLLKDVEDTFRPTFRYANPTRPVIILFTSGTSGLPKGALLSERFYMSSRLFMHSVFTMTAPAYTSMLSPPLFWISSVSNLLVHIKEGHRVVFFRGPPSESVLISGLRKYEALFWVTGPAAIMHLANWPTKPRCPALKLVITTGMPFPMESIIKARDQVFEGKVQILQVYGMTEIGIVTNNTPLLNKMGSTGKVFVNIQMKVIERDTGLLLGPDMEGELCFKSPSMMLGYYNNPEATEDAIDENGFFHTGDLGYYDKEGFVYVTGRLKELIKWKSYQVVPMEVELHLLHQDAVQEALVFGLFENFEAKKARVLKHRDMQGRPVVYIPAKHHNANDRDIDELTKFIVYCLEEACKKCFEEVVDNLCIVFDLREFGLSCMDYQVVKNLIWLLSRHYPERLGVCLIINSPTLFTGCWAVIKGWLDENTAGKVTFVSSEEDLCKYLIPDILPDDI